MPTDILDEEELAVVTQQFGQFLHGKATPNNLILSVSEVTMHTDTHTDTHSDSSS